MAELHNLGQYASVLREIHVEPVAVLLKAADARQLRQVAERTGFPFELGWLDVATAQHLDEIQRQFVIRKRPLAAPTSLLLNEQGQVAIIYRGRMKPQQLLADVSLLRTNRLDRLNAAVHFPGRWQPPTSSRIAELDDSVPIDETLRR